MKKIFILLFSISTLVSFAQDNNDIEITPYIDDSNTDIATEAKSILLNKLTDIIVKNGVVKGINTNFILTASTNLLGKEITPTAPTNYVLQLGVNLFIGNAFDQNLFSSTQITATGVGISETKAYIDAIKNIKSSSPQIVQMIASSKTKIVDYYNKRCDLIIAEASQLEKTNNFDAALYKLMSIPQACKACYGKSMAKAEVVFKKAIDFECKVSLNKARQIWNANPNEAGASEATEILMSVNPNANCFAEVKSFGSEISKKMNENDKRNWDVYYLREVGLEKERIQAIKEIGKAYGQGQPKQVFNTVRLRQ